jgi:heme-degrading monooxygenase HmoA
MTAASFARLPAPPYYAVIFSSQRSDGDDGDDGYDATAERMVELASAQPGFLGVESTRGADGFGITVSYWASEEAIAAWKAHAEHRLARESGRARWYAHYELRVARVERAYAKLR